MRSMNSDISDKIVRGAHILEELSYKYRYRAHDIATYLCKYLRDKTPSGNREEIQTPDHVVEIIRVIVALPRTD